MHYSQGILTVRGGMTSHAAVVARGLGTCCVSDAAKSRWTRKTRSSSLQEEHMLRAIISLDGSTGNIYGEAIPTVPAFNRRRVRRIMAWADQYRTLEVRTNADTPKDAQQAAKSALRELVSAVQSTCSLNLTEFQLSEK